MAKRPVHNSLLLRVAFNQPELYATTPLTWSGLLSLYSKPMFSLGDLDLLHGLYQRIELDSSNARIDRFKLGERFYLKKDISDEMRAGIRRWNELWVKMSTTEDMEYDGAMDAVHLFWTARLIEHLREELYLLSTTDRACQYVVLVESRRIEVVQS
jgi:hypothetical protein